MVIYIFLQNFSKKLKNERQNQKLTQDYIAKKLNITRAAYGEYERGNNLPPIDKLIIIADTLKVSIDYLLDRNEFNINQVFNELQTEISATIENKLKEWIDKNENY